MKGEEKDEEKHLLWDQMKTPTAQVNATAAGGGRGGRPMLMVTLLLFVSLSYFIYTLKLLSSSQTSPCHDTGAMIVSRMGTSNASVVLPQQIRRSRFDTGLQHVVFGVAASANLWEQRKNYIKLWWRPKQMQGAVWLDKPVKVTKNEPIPAIRISGDTSEFPYSNRKGHRSAIRISRIVSETLKLGFKDVRWIVMGDDDTVFIPDNLIRVLSKYDHRQFYYIGSLSESHLQNIHFSYGMAYGGGGFAVSYPLAVALSKMQDRCIHRYPGLYGSDDRMQACMAELGVPLTKEIGFHQYDVYGNLFGLLAAHPVTPLVSLHHLDVVEPIFPNLSRVEALRRLFVPVSLDSAGIMQQSICYDKAKRWTISVSWGFAVQILRGILSPREMEMPSRTFLNWYRRADYTAYAFNTRPVARNPCQKPFVFYLSSARFSPNTTQTVTEYSRHQVQHPHCRWKMQHPSEIDRIIVYKKRDPSLWERSPRRNCCRLMPSIKKGTMVIDVGVCKDETIITSTIYFGWCLPSPDISLSFALTRHGMVGHVSRAD
ncbi:uncharacterized protein [Aristolochia californica]|uniref:uncharacterized protein isoform X1 n=1 Tax=Aristolochia californica TaxID=171875 RepID=UPI0035DADFA0